MARIDISDHDQVNFEGEIEIIKKGKVNGILYWFDLQFSDDETNVFDTSKSWNFHRTCTLLNTHKTVKLGEKFSINVLRMDGYMKLNLN